MNSLGGGRVGRFVEVDAFFFGDQGASEDEGVNGANVLANDAKGDELDGTEEEEAQDDGAMPTLKLRQKISL